MRLRTSGITLAVVVAVMLVSRPASTQPPVGTRLTCPPSVLPGPDATVELLLSNWSCSAQDARVISTTVGNAKGAGTAGDLGLLGPVVADPQVSVPAGTNQAPGTCVSGFCQSFFSPLRSCATDSDCCRSNTPGIANVEIALPYEIPTSFSGTVATQLITTQLDGQSEVDTDQCMIRVPEPALGLQLAWAMGTLALLRLRAAGRALGCERPKSFEEIQS